MSAAIRESALRLELQGEQMVAILAEPAVAPTHDCAVLVVVGGPQYRVGSHRQFVLLSRALAAAGFPVMRFDFRGMGDSSGAMRDFTDVHDDIAAALDALQLACPGVKRIVLWGLCDGASAACFYMQHDPRVAGAILLNPWVRSEAGEAKVMLKHYYLQRVFSRSFWGKLLSGRFQIGKSVSGLMAMLGRATASRQAAAGGSHAMAGPLAQTVPQSLANSGRPALVLLSGNDFVAAEFKAAMADSAVWKTLLNAGGLKQESVAEADHTFSTAQWRGWVEAISREWLSVQLDDGRGS